MFFPLIQGQKNVFGTQKLSQINNSVSSLLISCARFLSLSNSLDCLYFTLNIVSDTCTWKRWLNVDSDPSDGREEESLTKLINEFGTDACATPMDFQARSVRTKIFHNSTGNRFEYADKESGLLCLNVRQCDGQCEDYEIRFCCPLQPEKGTRIRYSCPESEYYLDFKDDQFPKTFEMECQENGKWLSKDIQSKELCSDGTNTCALPKIPSCHSRKIECPLRQLPNKSYAKRTLVSSGNSVNLDATYSYKCAKSGE